MRYTKGAGRIECIRRQRESTKSRNDINVLKFIRRQQREVCGKYRGSKTTNELARSSGPLTTTTSSSAPQPQPLGTTTQTSQNPLKLRPVSTNIFINNFIDSTRPRTTNRRAVRGHRGTSQRSSSDRLKGGTEGRIKDDEGKQTTGDG